MVLTFSNIMLTDNGRLGFITPNNYFTSLAGLSLRQYFSQHKCLDKIIDFSHKKVFDAQTYTAISFVSKKNNEAILYDKIKDEIDDFLIQKYQLNLPGTNRLS